MINVGDLVITHGGGNKMKVLSIVGTDVKCAWICDVYQERYFSLEEIILYDSYILAHNRQETINNILNSTP